MYLLWFLVLLKAFCMIWADCLGATWPAMECFAQLLQGIFIRCLVLSSYHRCSDSLHGRKRGKLNSGSEGLKEKSCSSHDFVKSWGTSAV